MPSICVHCIHTSCILDIQISNTTSGLLVESLTWSQMSCMGVPIWRATRHQWHRPAAYRQATELLPPRDCRAVWRTSSWSLWAAPVGLASSTVACEVWSGGFETTPITATTACQTGNNGCSTWTLFRTFEWIIIYVMNSFSKIKSILLHYPLPMFCCRKYYMRTKNVCPTIIHRCNIAL